MTITMEIQLEENLQVRQRPDEGFRRWFVNRYFELIVWYDAPGGALIGFQLCLSRHRDERAFTWTQSYVSSHFVSEGPQPGQSRQSTGILKGDGRTISQSELDKFLRESQRLEPELRQLVIDRITEYNQRRS